MRRLARLLALCAFSAAGAAASPQPGAAIPYAFDIEHMAVDRDVAIGDVKAACTGIGDTRTDARWAAYPIRVEFSNAKNEYMVDALVALVDAKGEAVLVVRCDSPWLLLKPPPGSYAVYAQLMDSGARMRSSANRRRYSQMRSRAPGLRSITRRHEARSI